LSLPLRLKQIDCSQTWPIDCCLYLAQMSNIPSSPNDNEPTAVKLPSTV
jgi:hypothetical protein